MNRIPRFRRSLRTQLILTNVVALGLILSALGATVQYSVRAAILSSVDRELDTRLRRPDRAGHRRERDDEHRTSVPPRPAPSPSSSPNTTPSPSALPSRTDQEVTAANLARPRLFFLHDGTLVERFGDSALPVWNPSGFARARSGADSYATVTVGGSPVRVLTRPLKQPGHPVFGFVQAAYPLTDVYRAIRGLNRVLLFLSPVALLCAGLGGAFLTNRVLRRVRTLSQAAGRIGADNLSARLPSVGDDEFSELAATFNGLLSRVEGAFRAQTEVLDQQRRFIADASHELKTPLTTIKGAASMALGTPLSPTLSRQSLVEIDRAADTMARLVQDLLLLARTDGDETGAPRIEVLLREILERALPPSLPGHARARIALSLTEESLTVVGSELDLVRLFRNLLDNAVRYTASDGTVEVHAARVSDTVEVRVIDTGIGIAPEHLPHLGERFYRIDQSRSRPDGGTGLGLSICRSIAAAHGGGLVIESTPGVGTRVIVTLPHAAG